MSMGITLPDYDLLPKGFIYPEPFLRVVRLNLTDIEPWYILDKAQVLEKLKGLHTRYPQRLLIPFAKRDDCDDVACFDLKQKDIVQIIHDFASEGYEQRKVYSSFWEWFREAIEEMINFE